MLLQIAVVMSVHLSRAIYTQHAHTNPRVVAAQKTTINPEVFFWLTKPSRSR